MTRMLQFTRERMMIIINFLNCYYNSKKKFLTGSLCKRLKKDNPLYYSKYVKLTLIYNIRLQHF